MAIYVKANKKVAAYLGLTLERNQLKDGNYLLWQADMLRFGPLAKLGETLQEIGGLSLTPTEAREEQDGVTLRTLPDATDPRFYEAKAEPEPVTVETGDEAASEGETEDVSDDEADGREVQEENASTAEASVNPNDEEESHG
jgi:hypothetical protein